MPRRLERSHRRLVVPAERSQHLASLCRKSPRRCCMLPSPTHLCISQHEPHALPLRFDCTLFRSPDMTLITICVRTPSPIHQTVTEVGTAPCQPPSPTTRATTATPEARTTAPTTAAAAPPVSFKAFQALLKGHSEVTKASKLFSFTQQLFSSLCICSF